MKLVLISETQALLATLWLVAAVFAGMALAPGTATADPIIRGHRTSAAGGFSNYDVDVDFRDGAGRSGFVQITLTGPFEVGSQLTVANWPDIQQTQTGGTMFMLQGGTGGGSSVDVVEVAQMIVPTGSTFAYSAVISRSGQNFTVAPEPTAATLASTSLVALAALTLRRASRP